MLIANGTTQGNKELSSGNSSFILARDKETSIDLVDKKINYFVGSVESEYDNVLSKQERTLREKLKDKIERTLGERHPGN